MERRRAERPSGMMRVPMDATQADEPAGADVAGRVRWHRQRHGWTQEQLARKARVSRGTVTRVEGGTERPLPRTAEALAHALGVETDRLLGLDVQPALFPAPDELRMDIIRRVVGMPDDVAERCHGAVVQAIEAASRATPKPGRRSPRRTGRGSGNTDT